MLLEIIFIVIVICLVVFIFFQFAPTSLAPDKKIYNTSSVCFKENCFKVELAVNEAQRAKGLMNRTELGKDKGMLFIFDKESIYPFWMKNTLIPLDIIWVDSNNKVVFIKENVQPCFPGQGQNLICSSVVPTKSAKYVLEINAGLCQQIGLKVGDELKFN